jgi:hypothetical protein
MAFTGLDSIASAITGGKSIPLLGFQRTIDTGATSAAGRWHSALTSGGSGGAMTLTGTAGTGVVMNGSTVGRLPMNGNVDPDLRHLLSLMATTPATTLVPGLVMLTDILHIYPSCALTGTPSTLSNHPTWTGTGNTRMTNANGVQCSLLVTTATTAGNGQITPTYLDQGGASQAAPSSLYAPSTTTPAGCFYAGANAAVSLGGLFMPLAAGDFGVQQITSYAVNTGATSGVGCFILHRPIAAVPLAAANTPAERSFVGDPFLLPRIYDDSCLGIIVLTGGALTASQVLTGSMGIAWG